jgi:hypothetical protein
MTMMTAAAIGTLAATIAVGACSQAPPSRLADDTAPVATLPTGTSGEAGAVPDDPEVSTDLPSTASPLAAAGMLGIAPLAGASLVRAWRRRQRRERRAA